MIQLAGEAVPVGSSSPAACNGLRPCAAAAPISCLQSQLLRLVVLRCFFLARHLCSVCRPLSFLPKLAERPLLRCATAPLPVCRPILPPIL